MLKTPLSCYQADLLREDFRSDPAQQLAVENLQALFEALLAPKDKKKGGLFSKLIKRESETAAPITGLYFWGGVGRGKTYLVDTFFDCLPFEQKLRMHFHRFMHRVHNELKVLRKQDQRVDPLETIADGIAKEARVLCFDEFVVSDIADAVILAKLMDALFSRGVTLVATSNVEPKELYKGGLQRDLFLPAIDLIYQHTNVLNIDSGVDYRLLFLKQAEVYFYPDDEKAEQGLNFNFDHLSSDQGIDNGVIEIEGRDLSYLRRGEGIIWFDFSELCEGPRSQNDYIEIARCFHSLILSGVPSMDRYKEDAARRFINLIDVMYDHNVKLIMSAECEIEGIYTGTRVAFEFQRTISRVKEMQSYDYFALSHKP
jgi:cell division protein ZapE